MTALHPAQVINSPYATRPENLDSMPKTKSVPVVSVRSTKPDEIEAIRKMAQAALPGSYLSSLFTIEFVNWVERQILDDGCCDMRDALQFAWEDASKARSDASGEVSRHDSQIKGLNSQIEALKRQVAAAEERMAQQIEFTREVQGQLWDEQIKSDKINARYHGLLQAIGWESKPEDCEQQ